MAKGGFPGGMGGGANMQQLMMRAQRMKQDVQRTQAELAEREFSASAGGGMVTATQVTGGLVWVRGRVWHGPVWRRFRPQPTSTTAQGCRISSPTVTGWPDPAEGSREQDLGREALKGGLERDPMEDPGSGPVGDRKRDQGVNPSR